MEMSTLTLTDVTERLYRLERAHTATRLWSFVLLMLLVANLGLVLAVISRAARLPERAKFTTVEARQFVLSDPAGARRGVLEVSDEGSGRLALVDGSRTGKGTPYFSVSAPGGQPRLVLLQAGDAPPNPRSAVEIGAEPYVRLSDAAGGASYLLTARGTGRPAR